MKMYEWYMFRRLLLTNGWDDGMRTLTRTTSRLNIAMSVLSPWMMMTSLQVSYLASLHSCTCMLPVAEAPEKAAACFPWGLEASAAHLQPQL